MEVDVLLLFVVVVLLFLDAPERPSERGSSLALVVVMVDVVFDVVAEVSPTSRVACCRTRLRAEAYHGNKSCAGMFTRSLQTVINVSETDSTTSRATSAPRGF